MMKLGYPVFVVEAVEDAVKFYSDKLAFDVAELRNAPGSRVLEYALLKKGKCLVAFRVPHQQEVVDFSQVKYCMMRGAGLYAEMKKGIEKYYERCRKKRVEITQELAPQPFGVRSFAIKDPFGFRVVFAEPLPNYRPDYADFCGFKVNMSMNEDELLEDMVHHLRTFGLSRRCSKKYAKQFLKEAKKK